MNVEEMKAAAAETALEHVEDEMVIGLGTGSTVEHFIQALGARVRDGLNVCCVPSSKSTARMAGEHGLRLLDDFLGFTSIDLAVDGADEIDRRGNAIKGGGGALTREKIIAHYADRTIIIVDERKWQEKIGAHSVPVEVLPLGWLRQVHFLEGLGCKSAIRTTPAGKFISDNSNYIIDCQFGDIDDPDALAATISCIPGVVEHGLFTHIIDLALVAEDSGLVREEYFD